MKQFGFLLCILMACVALSGCAKTVGSTGEMLQIMAQEEQIAGQLQLIGIIEKDGYSFVTAIYSPSERFGSVYAAEFENREDGSWSFGRMLPLYSSGNNCYYTWRNGLVFVCNDENAAYLWLKVNAADAQTVEMTVDVEQTPWLYYYETPAGSYQADYYYYDSEGNILR